MNNKRIRSLQELKDWNLQYAVGSTYRKEHNESKYPILLEWFLDWFFEEALLDIHTAGDAFKEYVIFAFICTDLDFDCALGRCLSNLNYWYNRASYYNSREKQYRKFKSKYI